ncbi:MAG TPA: hypothetical protein VG889_19820 [Rhizomicrobium sp.]|nr:hypothetical protein [Rhizomicrobium sp.]
MARLALHLRAAALFCVTLTATCTLGGPAAHAAAPSSPPPNPATRTAPPVRIAKNRDEWRDAVHKLRRDKAGCFLATYPKVEWKEVACGPAGNIPFLPRHGSRSNTVGNGFDFSGRVTNPIVEGEGTFDAVITQGESGFTAQSPTVAVPDAYSLQINSNFGHNSFCTGNCLAWQQAVFSNQTEHALFMQYWLINWPTACPSGWNNPGPGYCFTDSPHFNNIPVQSAANLPNVKLKMDVSSSLDSVELDLNGTSIASVTNPGSTMELYNWWRDSEFNIVGDCCGFSADFTPNSTMVVHNTIHHNSTVAPACVVEGFTGETNNLTLVGSTTASFQSAPAILFVQSNVPGTTASCVSATGLGDVHLTTLSGLLYDFQASGAFLMLSDGSTGFQVQNLAQSGAPNWPQNTVNKQVATRMGDTTLAVCIEPDLVEIDGQPTSMTDGQTITMPDGVRISRAGNSYTALDTHGNSMRAELNSYTGTDWINLYVGMGHRPDASTVGLLVNPNNNVNQLATRNGAVLNEPVSFDDLYGRYGKSWRLSDRESALCNSHAVKWKKPARPFYAEDLKPKLRDRAMKACMDAGVTILPLLDACTLDVAFADDKAAAQAFVGQPAPVAVHQAGKKLCRLPPGGRDRHGSHNCPG